MTRLKEENGWPRFALDLGLMQGREIVQLGCLLERGRDKARTAGGSLSHSFSLSLSSIFLLGGSVHISCAFLFLCVWGVGT